MFALGLSRLEGNRSRNTQCISDLDMHTLMQILAEVGEQSENLKVRMIVEIRRGTFSSIRPWDYVTPAMEEGITIRF